MRRFHNARGAEHHADQGRRRPRKVGPFRHRDRGAVRAAPGRGDRPRRGERHVPDRSARPRRLFRQPVPCRLRPRRRRRGACRRQRRARACARRPRGDVLSVVRRLRQLPTAAAELLRARPQPEVGRHPRRRLDLAGEERRAGLQRVLPAILVRHFRPEPGALHRQSAQRRAARIARPARLQRPDRRRRRAERHEAGSRARASPYSASARSDCRR